MALGASVYKMIFDTQGLEQVTASRREIALQKKIMEETTPAVEKLAASQVTLDRLVTKGLIDQEKRNEVLAKLTAELPENVAAEEERNRVLKNAQDILASLQTKEQEFAEKRANAWEALQAGLLVESEYQQVISQSPTVLAAAAAAEKELAAAEAERAVIQKNAQGILAGLETDEQRFAQTRAEAWEALQAGLIHEQDYQQVLSQSPKVLAAEAAALKEGAAAVRAYEDERKHGLALNKEFMPASEQARNKLTELKAAYAAGHVSQSSYRNGLIQLTATQLTGIPVIGKMASTLASVGPIGIVVAGVFGGIAIAAKLVSSAVHTVTDNVAKQIKKIDDLVAASETIGIPVDQFQRLSHAADLANISQSEFSGGTEKMLVGISKGADGSKKLVDAFNLIGLDAGKLRDMEPDAAFAAITKALDTVPNAADKARAATAIFGSADFLRINTSHIEDANKLFGDLRAGLSKVDSAKFGDMDNSVKNMNAALDVTWQKVAMEIVPALSDAAEVATEWLVGLNQSETFTDTLETIGVSMSAIVATAKELPGVIDKWTPSLNVAATVASAVMPQSFAAGELLGVVAKDVGGEAQRQNDLDAQIKARQDAGLNGGKPIVEDDDVDSVSGMTKELEKQVKQLEEAAEYAGIAKEEIVLLKLAEAGASAEVRNAAAVSASRIMQLQREEEATKELAKAIEDAINETEAAEKKRQDAIAGTIDGLDEQIRKLQMSEREQLAHSLAVEQASETETEAALKKFDNIKALEKERDATKLATDAIADLEKQLKQTGMTPEEKKIDDLKTAGVSDDQLAIIDTLQKELALRGDIKSAIEATSGVIKAGSREAADAFSKANQSAVLSRFNRDRKAMGAPVLANELGPGLQGGTITAPPPRPVVSGVAPPMIADQAKEQLKEAQKQTAILSQINEKTVPLTIEEVTL